MTVVCTPLDLSEIPQYSLFPSENCFDAHLSSFGITICLQCRLSTAIEVMVLENASKHEQHARSFSTCGQFLDYRSNSLEFFGWRE